MTLPPGARHARPVRGGHINEAFRVAMRDGGEAFVKTRAGAAAGEFAAEAAGLRWLAEPGALRTPRVLAVTERYLALEWIEPGELDAAGERELGRGLALTHAAHAPCFGRFETAQSAGGGSDGEAGARSGADAGPGSGADADGGSVDAAWFASLRLSNKPTDDWPTFYAERRLRPLARLARDRQALSPAAVQAIERVCERMDRLAGPAEPPARVHGDLWQGNVHADGRGRPWLIDPSAYGGRREVDLAMLALFGTPSPRTLDAYQDTAPLAEGWRERTGLYQLLPLLAHAVLFGGSYGADAERTARRYV